MHAFEQLRAAFFGRFKPLAEGIFYRIKRGLRPQRGLSLRGDVLFRDYLQTKLTIFYGAQNSHEGCACFVALLCAFCLRQKTHLLNYLNFGLGEVRVKVPLHGVKFYVDHIHDGFVGAFALGLWD